MLAGDTPLIDAARRGRAANVATLLADGAVFGDDVNESMTNGSGTTALHIACYLGHAEIVMMLLAANADVDQANIDGATALFYACKKGYTEIVTKLLAASADANRADKNGCTPMYLACEDGHTVVVAMLLAANADVNDYFKACPIYGLTPIAIACHHGHLAVVQILTAYGARRGLGASRRRSPSRVWETFVMPHMVTRDYQPPQA